MTRLLFMLVLVLAGCAGPVRRAVRTAPPRPEQYETHATNRTNSPVYWTDTNGCQWTARNGVTNGPRCFPPRTNLWVAWDYGDTNWIVFEVFGRPSLTSTQWVLRARTTSLLASVECTNQQEFLAVRARNTITGLASTNL